jgi:hypothetical protein
LQNWQQQGQPLKKRKVNGRWIESPVLQTYGRVKIPPISFYYQIYIS